MLLVVLGLFGAGSVALPFLDENRRTEVFPSGQASRPAQALPEKSRAPSQAAGAFAVAATATPPAASAATPSAGPMPGVAADGRIDLNTASAEALDTLPGVGPSRAAAIIALRNRRGGFRSVEELDDVPGFGPATLEKLRGLVTVSPPVGAFTGVPASPQQARPSAFQAPAAATPAPAAVPVAAQPVSYGAVPRTSAYSAAPQGEYSGPVDINRAGAEQLATLKYVGPKLAQAIIVHRTRYGAFRRPEDLEAVKGIGRRVIEANRGRILVR